MENCKKTIHLQVQCNCSSHVDKDKTQNSEGFNIELLYQKFAEKLEFELKQAHDQYNKQVDELNNHIFNLKNTVQRLEIRNKRDSEAERDLRRQYNLLLIKLKEMGTQSKGVEVKVIERVKEVQLPADDTQLLEEMNRWKKKAEEANYQYCSAKHEKQVSVADNENLRQEIICCKNQINKLKDQLNQSKLAEEEKDKIIEKLKSQNEFLKNNREVICQTKHFFPDFKSTSKQSTETKIQTIYVEKPVQKLVLVQVQKRIKQFIQPERAVVNRIITCQPTRVCKCDEEQNYSKDYEAQFRYMSDRMENLEGNIKSYQSERQKLVGVIQDKNSELNFLETKFRLMGSNMPSYGPSAVNVTVTKLSDENKPVNQKINHSERQTRVKF